jgi:lipopolysaccharide transport system ATP-binding protein
MSTVISIENLWKEYRLGVLGYGTLRKDVQSWWARLRGQEDPNLPVDCPGPDGDRRADRIWALRDVSLEIQDGEVLGIIGRNGSGKSTLLKIISRVTAPTEGSVKIKGRVAGLLEVGTGFHPELTGRENVFLNGAILGMTVREIKKKFDEIVDFSGVEKFIGTPVKRYSSGMYVRLAFAVAAHLDSEILVVDEVLAVGDAAFQEKCSRKMNEITRAGRTILFVSHNMGKIKTLCQKAVLFDEGRLKSKSTDVCQMVKDYLGEDPE